MKLVRSWPRAIPEGRSYVVDGIEHVDMDNVDYRPVFEGLPADDVLLLEWDIAVAKEHLEAFAIRASSEPERILVAPYKLYKGAKYQAIEDMWVHRRWDGTCDPPVSDMPRTAGWHPVQDDEPTCNLFGFGLIYLPKDIIRRFLRRGQNWMSDTFFSVWHYRFIDQEVPIAWECPAVHLNFEVDPTAAPYA